MARCPAHGNRIQLNSSRAVNLFGASPQPDCRWIEGDRTHPHTRVPKQRPAWVEQKNGMLIRRVMGYERLVGLEAAQLLAELYAALRLYRLRGSFTATTTSFSQRSSSKAAHGRGRIKRQHLPPRTRMQ